MDTLRDPPEQKRPREALPLRAAIGIARVACLLIGITILLGAAMATSYAVGRTWELVALLAIGIAPLYAYYLLGVRRLRDAAIVALFLAVGAAILIG